ncbi:MAG: penicillin acylase family protein [Anaerolineae bacterium]|nr:penicillin acylase family protein [Anaerolineae bacterium]
MSMRSPCVSVLSAVLIVPLLALLLPVPAPAQAQVMPSAGERLQVDGGSAEIVRDAYGVPHIYASTQSALFHAYGYAVAQDRLWQLDVYRRTARGTLAEVLGDEALASDRHERIYGYTEAEYTDLFAGLPVEIQEIIQAYRDGVNAYIARVLADPDHLLPWEYGQLGCVPEPWEVIDTLAVGRFMANRFGASGGREIYLQAVLQYLLDAYGEAAGEAMFEDLFWLNDPDAPVSAPEVHVTTAPAPREPLYLPDVARIASQVADLEASARAVWDAYGVPLTLGSYAWAVAPSRSADGHAWLYGGPQMGFETPDVVHEVQLTGGDGLNFIGVGFAGVPLPMIGHNEWLAWSMTSGMGDNGDVYVETLDPADPERYWYEGAWTPMITRTETIEVAGRATPVTEIVRRTVHGPVIALDEANDLAYSLRQAQWMQEQRMFAGLLAMLKAHNLTEFQVGVASFWVSNHILYADRAGHIAYWQAGKIPIRPDGRHVGRLPWPGDGSAEWSGAWRPTPHVVDPPQGYLANWNNKASPGFDNGDDVRLGKQDRVLEILELLAADDSITREAMRAMAMRIGSVKLLGNETRYLRAYLLAAVAAEAPDDPRLQEAANRLAAWDGHAVVDILTDTHFVPEEQIWNTWLTNATLAVFGDELGSYWEDADLNTLLHAVEGAASGVPPSRNYPDQIFTAPIEGTNEILVQALDATLIALADRYGTSDMDAWLEPRPMLEYVHTFGLPLGQAPLSNRATYAQIIALSDPIVAENVLPLGQSAFIDPDGVPDPHFGDQLALYGEFRYKPMRLTKRQHTWLPLLFR